MLTCQDLVDFELRVKALWEAGQIKAPLHLCGGNEEQLIEIFKEVKPHDYVFSTHRNHYHALLHGVPPEALLAEICGHAWGTCMGKARSMGFIDAGRHFYSSAIVGGLAAVAVGTAWALRQQQLADPLAIDEHAATRHVWCFVGDGALDGGHFWEALNYAIGNGLPVTFVIEDNDRATCSSKKDRGAWFGNYLARTLKHNYGAYVRQYSYEPTYPHVGSGTYVQF